LRDSRDTYISVTYIGVNPGVGFVATPRSWDGGILGSP